MFENGSFLRRRKRFKLEDGLDGNVKSMSKANDQQSNSLPEPISSDRLSQSLMRQHQTPSPQPLSSSSPLPPTTCSPLYNPAFSLSALPTTALNNNPLLFGAQPQSHLSAAYSQMLMQYYAMLPALWGTPTINSFSSTLPSTTPYVDPKLMVDYLSLLQRQTGVQSTQSELTSDCESQDDRSSPLSLSQSSDQDCYIVESQERALDLSSKF